MGMGGVIGNQGGGTSWNWNGFGTENNGGTGSNGNSGGSSWSWGGNGGNTGKNNWSYSWGPHHRENDEAPSRNHNKHHPQQIKIIINNSKKTNIRAQPTKTPAKASSGGHNFGEGFAITSGGVTGAATGGGAAGATSGGGATTSGGVTGAATGGGAAGAATNEGAAGATTGGGAITSGGAAAGNWWCC